MELIGKTISHYQILEKLGQGGMGVVYKAHDVDLDRIVAIKGLPEHFQEKDIEYQRFMREARAASALNHPNVCTIYDFLKVDGKQYIVMEYVDGMTLRDRMTGTGHGVPMPSSEAISFAIQITAALEEAHNHGIVHRDVKPTNIMINAKNQAKVMDFGLAKLKGSMKITRTESTLGTVAYMSPEQLRGEDVDHRSDLFSLGIVLYEMFTGRLPFRGEYEPALVYSIVNEKPQPIQKLIPGMPSDVTLLMDRLLQKNPDQRYQTSSDVAADLRLLAEKCPEILEPLPGDKKASRLAKPSKTMVGRPWWNNRIWRGVLVLVIIGLVYALMQLSGRKAIRLNDKKTFHTLKIPFTHINNPALSRDGNWLAYSAAEEDGLWNVHVFNIVTEESFKVTHETYKQIIGIDISPDMSQIVYGCQKEDTVSQEIKMVSFHGGISRKIADYGIFPHWKPNGERIGYIHLDVSLKFEIWGVHSDGKDNRFEFGDSLTRIQSGVPLTFCWSPDGKSIAWVRNFPQGFGEVMVYDSKRGHERPLTAKGKRIGNLVWTLNNRIIFPVNEPGNLGLWTMTSRGKGELQITQGADPIYDLTASTDGRKLVFEQSEIIQYLWISDLNGGNERQVTFDDVRVQYAAFSPDRKYIAAVMGDMDRSKSERHLYLMDRYGKNRIKLTSGSQMVGFCRWSSDGNWLAYSCRSIEESEDSASIYLIQPFHPGAPRYIAKGQDVVWIGSEDFVIPFVPKTFQYSVRGDVSKRVLCEDSTAVIRMPGKKYLNIIDIRKNCLGVWIALIDKQGKPIRGSRKVGPLEIWSIHSPDISYFLYENEGGIWRMHLPSGKSEKVGSIGPGTRAIVDVSADGKEILLIKGYPRSKFIMLENAFE